MYESINVINASIFGAPSQRMAAQFEAGLGRMAAETIGSAGSSLLEYAKGLHQKYNGQQMRAMINSALNATKVESRPDLIFMLNSLAELRQAQPVMQEFIMANPVVRRAYQANQCFGFADSYVDSAPGKIGWGHKTFDTVMSGVVEFEEDGITYTVSSQAFADADTENITPMDRTNILATWRIAERIMKEGVDDPTNQYGGSL